MTKLKAVANKAARKSHSRNKRTPLTRLTPPPSRGRRLARPVLDERFVQLQEHSLTLLVAPQGYGKTNILSRWYTSLLDLGTRPVWITLKNSDNNPARLAHILHDACVPVLTSSGSNSVEVQDEEPRESIHQLCNKLHESDGNLLLIIDQYDALTDPAAIELLTDFLFQLPPDTHRVLASTSTPHWVTPKLQLEENIQFLDREMLAFSAPELEEFLQLEGHTSLSEEDILTLMDTTGGWPAALRLASMALKKVRTPRDHSAVIHGTFPLLSEYLDRNIISELPHPLQMFLRQTAHLERLRVDLCKHVCNSDNANNCLQELLDRGLLEGNNYADNWFSYPPLLHNFLVRQLQKEGRSDLAERHCRASDWYLEFGLAESSFHHALQAQDFERAVAIHSVHYRDLIVAGGAALIEQFIKSIPTQMIEDHPYILWPYTWVLVISQRFAEATEQLSELQRRLESGIIDNSAHPMTPTAEELKILEYRIKQARDREWADPSVWLKLKKQRGVREDFLQEQIELSLGSAYLKSGKFSDAYTAFHEAKRLAELNCTPITTVSATTRMAEIRYMQGQLTEAMYLCTEAIDSAALVPGQLSSFTGIPLLLSSRILFDKNQLAESEQSFYEARDMFRMYRASHYLTDSAIHRARLANAHSGWQNALHTLEEAIANLSENIHESNINQLRAEQVKYEVLGGQLEQAEAILKRLGAPLTSRGPSPTFKCKRSEDYTYLNYCRYLIASGKYSTASAWLTKLLNQAKAAERMTLCVEIAVLLVLAHDCGDDDRRTLRSVREMLLLADQTGVIRPLIEGGNQLQKLIGKFRSSQDQEQTDSVHQPSPALLELLLDPDNRSTQQSETGGKGSDHAVKPLLEGGSALTPRELELLTLIAEGLSNKMIASELLIGEGTVKWHLKNVFLKLDVGSRTQAASKARSMGLLV